MLDYKHFIEKIKIKVPKDMKEEPILRVQADSVEEIEEKASEYFDMPIEELNFEIESISSVPYSKKYSIIVYLNMNYKDSFFDTEAKNKDGKAYVRYGENGKILLLVTAAQGNGKRITLYDVIILVKKHISNQKILNESLIKKATLAAEERWVFIADYSHEPINDVTYDISFSEDEMTAFLFMTPPGENGAGPSKNKIMKRLKEVGVVLGIDEQLVAMLECMPRYNENIQIAVGEPVVHGDDAGIKIISSNEEYSSKEHDLAHRLKIAKKGEVIAEKVPFTHGDNGRTVTGGIIFPDSGQDIDIVAGKNALLNEDGNSVIALKDGAITLMQDKKIVVDDLLVIDSSLSLEIGNVNFPGSVLIKGDIPDDLEINVGGSLQVYGGISNSNLDVKGNLTVGRGIKGRGSARINVKGNIYSKFVESATLSIGSDCIIEQAVISSHILSKGKIIVASGRGRVLSSTLTSGGDMYIRSVGSELGENSTLEIKSKPKLRKLYEKLFLTKSEKIKELKRLRHFLGEEDTTLIKKILEEGESFSKDETTLLKYEMIEEKLKQIKKIQLELKDIVQKIKVLHDMLIDTKSTSYLYIIQHIKAGTIISIDDAKISTKNDLHQVVFYLNDDRISVRDYNAKKDIAKIERLMNSVK